MTAPKTPLPSRRRADAGTHPSSAGSSTRASATAAGQGTRSEDCVNGPHIHIGICQRAGYANGRADLVERLEAYLAEPDDRQEWEYVPGEITTVDVVRVDAIRRILLEPPC